MLNTITVVFPYYFLFTFSLQRCLAGIPNPFLYPDVSAQKVARHDCPSNANRTGDGKSEGNVGVSQNLNKTYFGNPPQVSSAGTSTCTSRRKTATTNLSQAVASDDSHSASLISHRAVAQGNAGSKLPVKSLSIPSSMKSNEGAGSSALSLSLKGEVHRTRKRSSSKSGDGKIHTPVKKRKQYVQKIVFI